MRLHHSCQGCAYWRPLGIESGSVWFCSYILTKGHSRPCLPGEGCTVKELRKRPERMARTRT